MTVYDIALTGYIFKRTVIPIYCFSKINALTIGQCIFYT